MEKIIKNNAKLYMTWLIMIVLISISVITTKFLAVVALALFVVYAVSSPISSSCVLLLGLMPFANIFKYQAGTTSFFTMCELLVVVLAVFRYRKIKVRFLAAIFMLAVYVIVTSVKAFNALLIIKLIAGFCFIYFLSCNVKKEDVINIAYLLAISTILMLLLSMNDQYFRYIEPYLLDLNYLIGSSGQRLNTMRLGGFLGDPNYCGILIIMSVALLCVLYYHRSIGAEFWVFIAFLTPLGFFTYSKSYFLCMTVLALFVIVFVLMPKHRGWAILSLLIVAGAVILTLGGKIEVINVIVERFQNGDLTTGRMALNKYYLNYIWDNPSVLLFGEGIAMSNIPGMTNTVHCVYIEGLYKLGILGCALYLYALSASVSHMRPCVVKRKIVDNIPLLFLLVMYSALEGLTLYEFPFYLAVAFLARNFYMLDQRG